jgi:hypothetical protein
VSADPDNARSAPGIGALLVVFEKEVNAASRPVHCGYALSQLPFAAEFDLKAVQQVI